MKSVNRVLFVILVGILLVGACMARRRWRRSSPHFAIGVLDNAEGSIGLGAQLGAHRFNQFGGVRGADGTLFQLELVIEPFDPATLSEACHSIRPEQRHRHHRPR